MKGALVFLTIRYLKRDGLTEVGSAAHPEAYFTEVNGVFRTRRDAVPQKLISGTWVDV